MSKIFSINEEEMNDATKRLNQMQNLINESVNSMSNSLKNLNSTGLFDISPIEKGIKGCSQSIENTRIKMNHFTDSISRRENMMRGKAEEIEVPKDFIKNDDMPYNEISDIKLSKEDGEGINKNNGQEKVEAVVISGVEKENLESIKKEDTNKVEEINGSTVEKEGLNDIRKDDTEKAEDIDESQIEKENLEKVGTRKTEEVKADMNSSINKKTLSDLTSSGGSLGSYGTGSSQSTSTSTSSSTNNTLNKKDDEDEEFMKSYAMYEEYMRNKKNDNKEENA